MVKIIIKLAFSQKQNNLILKKIKLISYIYKYIIYNENNMKRKQIENT